MCVSLSDRLGAKNGLSQDPVNMEGVRDGAEVRSTVVLLVDGADGDLDWDTARAAVVEKHSHFIFVALAGESEQVGENGRGEPAQAGLGVGEHDAAERTEDVTREGISEAAAEGHSGRGTARTENELLRVIDESLRDAGDVFDGVLAVGVGGDDAGISGACGDKIAEAGFQRAALACVAGMTKDGGGWMVAKAVEDWLRAGAAAVIDEQHGGAAGIAKGLHEGNELCGRLPCRDHDRDRAREGGDCHMVSSDTQLFTI